MCVFMTFKDELLKKVKDQEEKNAKILAAIPKEFHHYVMVLEHSTIIARKELNLEKELKDAGYYLGKDKKGNPVTYLKLKNLYLTVMGKNAILVDWAEQNNYRFAIENEIILIGQKPFIKSVITITDEKGEIIRKASSTAPVNIGGGGVDATNPFENAETSAVGRALTFLGMGQMGGIASYEEIIDAQKRQKQRQEPEVPEGFIVSSFEFKDETKTAGFVNIYSPDGEVAKIAGWGDIWQQFVNEVTEGDIITFKTETFKMQDNSIGRKLIQYQVVA